MQYFYIHGLWRGGGVILSFSVRMYRTVLKVLKVSFKLVDIKVRHIYRRHVYEFVFCYSPTYFLAYALSSPNPVDELSVRALKLLINKHNAEVLLWN
jgi:hypothetical protein